MLRGAHGAVVRMPEICYAGGQSESGTGRRECAGLRKWRADGGVCTSLSPMGEDGYFRPDGWYFLP